jgi:hypothetical protein
VPPIGVEAAGAFNGEIPGQSAHPTPHAKFHRLFIALPLPFCLGDIECYRMLGVYTAKFGSCHRAAKFFTGAGLPVAVHSHLFGCATSLIGAKPQKSTV